MNEFLSSRSLVPSLGASTVKTIALYPRDLQSFSICEVKSLSLEKYNWKNNLLWIGPISLIDLFEIVLWVIIVLKLLAAFALASSPSSCAICCIATGAIKIGESISIPKIEVFKSIDDTSLKSLGSSSYSLNIVLFLLRVTSSLAPDE